MSLQEMKHNNLKMKDCHSDLPSYVWVPISEDFLYSKTIGNLPSIETKTKYMIKVPSCYYKKINVITYETSEMP